MKAPELAQIVLRTARGEGWDTLRSFARLEARATSADDAELLQLVEALFDEVVSRDEADGRRGRDSGVFEWHDTGLASVMEILRARVGA